MKTLAIRQAVPAFVFYRQLRASPLSIFNGGVVFWILGQFPPLEADSFLSPLFPETRSAFIAVIVLSEPSQTPLLILLPPLARKEQRLAFSDRF